MPQMETKAAEKCSDRRRDSVARRRVVRQVSGKLQMVRFHDEEHGRDFMFLTNAISIKPLEVADLYRNRWQIELFFK